MSEQHSGHATSTRPPKPLERLPRPARPSSAPVAENDLNELRALAFGLPEPIAAQAAAVDAYDDDGDITGTYKQLFELGVGVVRYAVAVALAALRRELEQDSSGTLVSAPVPIKKALRSGRRTDGQWCELLRLIVADLEQRQASILPHFGFANALSVLIDARNDFTHNGARGDEAASVALRVLREAGPLLTVPLLYCGESGRVELRMGFPRRERWDTAHGRPRQHGVQLELAGGNLRLDGFLPVVNGSLHLPETPHDTETPWRLVHVDLGERHEAADLTQAIDHLIGKDPDAPRAMSSRPELVGRKAFAESFFRAAEQVLAGEPRMLVLTGPPGIGSSRLLLEARDAAHRTPFRYLSASCSSTRNAPLLPLRQAVSALGAGSALALLFDRVSGGHELPHRDFTSILDQVQDALIEHSSREPLLIALDEVEAADTETLQLLLRFAELINHGGVGRLLFLLTAREGPHRPAELTRLLGLMGATLGATRCLELDKLDPGQAQRLLSGVAPVAAPLAKKIIAEAAGLPFYLVQPLLTLKETERLKWRDGMWHLIDESARLPPLEELLEARLQSYFDATLTADRAAPFAAAVEGSSETKPRQAADRALALLAAYADVLDRETIGAVCTRFGIERYVVERVLQTLVDARILQLRPGPSYCFEQAIVRRTVEQIFRRQSWFSDAYGHLLDTLAARATEQRLSVDPAFLAAGYEELGKTALAVSWWLNSARRALKIGTFDTSVRHAKRARELLQGPEAKAEASLLVLEAQHRAGKLQEAGALAGATDWLRLSNPELSLKGQLLTLLADRESRGEPVPEDQLGALVVRSDALGARAAAEARLFAAASLRGRLGLSWLEEAHECLRRLDKQDYELDYRVLSLQVELGDEIAEDLEVTRRRILLVQEMAEQLGSTYGVLDAQADLAAIAQRRGKPQQAAKESQAIASRALKAGWLSIHRRCLNNAAAAHIRAKDARSALKVAKTALAAARDAGSLTDMATLYSQQAEAHRMLKQYGKAHAAISHTIRIREHARDRRLGIAIYRRGLIHRDQGRGAEARADFLRAIELAEAAGDARTLDKARECLGPMKSQGSGKRKA